MDSTSFPDLKRRFKESQHTFRHELASHDCAAVRGKVCEIIGTVIRATLPYAELGDLCELVTMIGTSHQPLYAEVVGFSHEYALLMPYGSMLGVSNKTEVIRHTQKRHVDVGPALLGRVIDAMGKPIDGLGEIHCSAQQSLYTIPPNPMERQLIHRPITTGVRCIDSILTVGEGQRMGIFAAAGGGKSSLLGMITKGSSADVSVIALIGERGREVREFIEHDLGVEGLKNTVVVVSTSDRPAMERAKAAYLATSIAEYFRDQGNSVMFMMDSVTRFARALREIGLSAGEPPTRNGYPPSVFATLPKLLERTGPAPNGMITALYTILVEGDDMNEPIADEVRSVLDGHIILSKKLADKNHYPAVDVLSSKSRVMNLVTTAEHQANAGKVRELLAKYAEIELLVNIGEFERGHDAIADEAMDKVRGINEFLKQSTTDAFSMEESQLHMQQAIN